MIRRCYIGKRVFVIMAYTITYDANLVWSGDAMANQLMQVVRNLKRRSNPPILLLPLESKANISFSLGWVS
ncbi:hypothetical protein CK203_027833 [Vitis vinifera]|uniref:Uncharacterized protein n=1 Tax=Vitis vinifera TaxID=29760 RepID=A0A438J3Q0_VITVI|nr:hypothetical protein CK203_027833 [Vitis vinifera]